MSASEREVAGTLDSPELAEVRVPSARLLGEPPSPSGLTAHGMCLLISLRTRIGGHSVPQAG